VHSDKRGYSAIESATVLTQIPGLNDRAASWKEIAAYFKRDVRTVQLWEKQEALPVYRGRCDRKFTVYAFKSQLDEWRRRRMPSHAAPALPNASPAERLESWKEIAAHFNRDVRTVQLWEKNGALPVYRQHHNRQSSVYAFKSQLDAWLRRAPARRS